MKYFSLILLVTSLSTPAFSAVNTKEEMHFKIVYGDKTTDLGVAKEKKGGTLYFSNNYGQEKTVALDQKTIEGLLKGSKTFSASNDQNLCPRNYIQFDSKQKTLYGCLGSKTKIAKQLITSANQLSTLVRLK